MATTDDQSDTDSGINPVDRGGQKDHTEAEPSTTGRPDPVFEELYRTQRAAMVRLAHLITGSNLAAQDIAQDAFLKLRPRLDRVDHPQAYLRQIVVNLSRAWLRRRDVERRHQPGEPEPVLAPELDEMWSALAQLSPRRRTALVLRFYEDLSVDQVAEAMDCRPGTAKSLIHRGIQSLKELIDD